MNWPPPETFWPKLYDELPDDADPVEFRKAVEAAVVIYEREAPDPAHTPPWGQIIKAFDNVLKETRRFNSLYGAARESVGTPRRAAIRPYVLNDVLKARDHADFQLQLERELEGTRQERLYDNLIVACAGRGRLQLSVSNCGPMTRVLKLILDRVLPSAGHRTGPRKGDGDPGLTEHAVKKIIKRYLNRNGGKVALGGSSSPPGPGLDTLPH
jgi:hypothetical protein